MSRTFSAETGGASVTLEGVTKDYRIKRDEVLHAVDTVDLVVPPGQFLSILGPSGCGKSTVLRMMASLEQPSTGELRIDEELPELLADNHRLGVAFQDHALLPWLSIRDNVALPFKVARREVDSTRVDELLKLVGLEGFEKARPRQLSGGMRQRASIARALVLKPALLLLDEPFGAVDAVTRRRLNLELQRIWGEFRITTVLVTHSVEEALFLAERVVVMSSRPGRIIVDREVPFAFPRQKELLVAPAFHEMAAELIQALDGQAIATSS